MMFTVRITRGGESWCAQLPVVIQADHPRQVNVEVHRPADVKPDEDGGWWQRSNRLSVTTWVPWFPSQGSVPVRLVLDTVNMSHVREHEGAFHLFEPGTPDRSLLTLMLAPAPQSGLKRTTQHNVDGGEEFPVGNVVRMWEALEANRLACRVARRRSIDPADSQGTESTAWGVKGAFLWVY